MSKSSKKDWYDIPKTDAIFVESIFRETCRKTILDTINKQISMRKKSRLFTNNDSYGYNCSEQNDPVHIARKNQMFIDFLSGGVETNKKMTIKDCVLKKPNSEIETIDPDFTDNVLNESFYLNNQCFIEKNTPVARSKLTQTNQKPEVNICYNNCQIANMYFCCVSCNHTKPITEKYMSYSIDQIGNCSYVAICNDCKDHF